jgi:hypothetical protein
MYRKISILLVVDHNYVRQGRWKTPTVNVSPTCSHRIVASTRSCCGSHTPFFELGGAKLNAFSYMCTFPLINIYIGTRLPSVDTWVQSKHGANVHSYTINPSKLTLPLCLHVSETTRHVGNERHGKITSLHFYELSGNLLK